MFSTHRFMSILASGVSFLAGLVTLIAFAVDIALFASVRLELDKFGGGTTTNPGPGSSNSLFYYPTISSKKKLSGTYSHSLFSILRVRFKQVFGCPLSPSCFFSSVVAQYVLHVAGTGGLQMQQIPIPNQFQQKNQFGVVSSVNK